jgi:membrane protein
VSASWERTRTRHPALARAVQPILDVWTELARVELVDRSLALGAQALLALIPLLMVLVTSGRFGAEGLDQVQDVMGATSFSRALQRMYALAWQVPRYRGLRAISGSVVWLVVWILMLQATAGLIRWTAEIPFTSLTLQVVGTSLIWWWTAHLLLGGRVSWRQLLPGGIATGALLVLLSRLSHVFMPPFTRANLDQFGSLGIVFAIASWLVMVGGVLIVATVLGRFVSDVLSPVGADGPKRWRRRLRPRG